jgi:nucleoside-diphosphate-sugar epimerase
MSIDDPLHSLTNNVLGTLNVMLAAKDAGVRRIVHASSSAVYGDDETLPKLESEIGKLLSPYAASKRIAELLQETFVNCYEIQIIGLRYFNVFGQKQDPDGAYAAVIPKFVDLLLDGKAPTIFGDGEQSRDFIFVSNIVAGNIAALTAAYKEGMNGEVFNIACSEITTINDLYYSIRDILAERNPQIAQIEPIYAEARTGDILHSFADISKARNILGFEPSINLKEGLAISIEWYLSNPQW